MSAESSPLSMDSDDKSSPLSLDSDNSSRQKRARAIPPPHILGVLPKLTLLQIALQLNKFEINALCYTNEILAYRLCGTKVKSFTPLLEDIMVIPELWQTWLQRQYGISLSAQECAAETRVYREMTALALKNFLERQKEFARQERGDQDADANPQTVLLRAYRYLYLTLSNSARLPLGLDRFETEEQNVALDTVLYGSMIMLRYNKAEQYTATLIASIVSVVAALQDVEFEEDSPENVFDDLLAGNYGRVLKFDETLLLRTPCVFRAVAAMNRNDSPLSLDYFIPPARSLDAIPKDDLTAGPGALRLSVNVSQQVVADTDGFETAEGFFDDDGDEILFCAHTLRPNNNRSILQLKVDFNAPPPQLTDLYRRIYTAQLNRECRWATTYFELPREYRLYSNTQTEKTYLYITNQPDDKNGGISIGRESSIVIAKHRNSGIENVVKMFSIADLNKLYRLPYSEVDDTVYAVDVIPTTFSTDGYTWRARYFIGVYERINSVEGPFNSNYLLIKVDLKKNGDLQSATLYTIPMPRNSSFLGVLETHIVSQNLFALTVRLDDLTYATILADLNDKIVYHGLQTYFQQDAAIITVEEIFVPTLLPSQRNDGDADLAFDSIPIGVDDLTL